MKVLVVDDLREFAKMSAFTDPDNVEIVYAKTSQDAIPLLSQEWDQIFLDHDLGLYSEKDASSLVPILCEDIHTGRWKNKTPPQIFVHSANPSGAASMEKTLRHYGFVVFRVDANDLWLIALCDD